MFPHPFANAALIQLAEANDSLLLLTIDTVFHVYLRHEAQMISLLIPCFNLFL
jgi:hypothetical protein